MLPWQNAPAHGQSTATRVCVRDTSGGAVVGAEVVPVDSTARGAVLTDGAGCAVLSIELHSGGVMVRHAGFADQRQQAGDSGQMDVVLTPAIVRQQVEVTDARVPLSTEANASSVLRLSAKQVLDAPGITLDDRLRDVVGFQLFRRTSSLVSNPTTQGTSLRGLASTAASRTLVLSDLVPLTDGFGGWVHWNEIPELAVAEVDVARGGASDLFGSSAIGGVINMTPIVPDKPGYALDLGGGSEATASLNGVGTARLGAWRGLGAASLVHSKGYVLTAPRYRGLVDTEAGVHSESGRVEARRQIGATADTFLRGNVLNEARANGTPEQTNATRIWSYVAGAGWSPTERGRIGLRAYGDRQGYRQSFSSIVADRSTETLTRLQRVPSEQFGGSAQWSGSHRALAWVAGADLGDTRATDAETPVRGGAAQATTSVSARQRQTGGYGELLWQPQTPVTAGSTHLLGLAEGWSAAISGRVDRFRSFDARQSTGTSSTALPAIHETVFDPRLGVVKQVTPALSLNGSVFRAFRGPTMNELYRTGQVGQQITEANPDLHSERATGFEAGGLVGSGRWGSLRASYFWTEINRPVAALTVGATATTVTQQRQNLGQLRSRGATAEWALFPASWLELSGGYQLAISTITRFDPQPTLVGTWTAQVPRNTATAQARLSRERWGTLLLDARSSGQQFDGSGNSFQLHSFTAFNLYAERQAWRAVRGYISAQNLFDRSIDAGRTPVLTLAQPRTILVGLRLH